MKSVVAWLGFAAAALSLSLAQGTSWADPQSRTESACTIGMIKDESGKSCEVPMPNSCTVATYPGFSEPWAEIDKGGRIECEFDQKKTDWKKHIVGSCGKCETPQCTARFMVKFNCSGNVPPASPKNPRVK